MLNDNGNKVINCGFTMLRTKTEKRIRSLSAVRWIALRSEPYCISKLLILFQTKRFQNVLFHICKWCSNWYTSRVTLTLCFQLIGRAVRKEDDGGVLFFSSRFWLKVSYLHATRWNLINSQSIQRQIDLEMIELLCLALNGCDSRVIVNSHIHIYK